MFMKEREKKLFCKILISTLSELGSSKKREKIKSSEKDGPCLKKITLPLLACESSGEKEPDREWVPSDCKAKYLGSTKLKKS